VAKTSLSLLSVYFFFDFFWLSLFLFYSFSINIRSAASKFFFFILLERPTSSLSSRASLYFMASLKNSAKNIKKSSWTRFGNVSIRRDGK